MSTEVCCLSETEQIMRFFFSFLFVLQASRSGSCVWCVHAEKFRLIVCCAPKEQLLSQGNIPSTRSSS